MAKHAGKDTIIERSFETLEPKDLRRLARVSLCDLGQLFKRNPRTRSRYEERLIALCLCQGSAEHLLRGGRGIKDFDVWAFFRGHPEGPFPYRRRGKQDFGPSKYGRHPEDVGFEGRRVDIIGRSIPVDDSEVGIEAIWKWLNSRADSAKHLKKRPVVVIYPEENLGRVVWDPVTCEHGGRHYLCYEQKIEAP